MNPIKILDKTLKSLKEHTAENPLPKEVIFLNADILKSLTNRDKKLIVEKLIKDGYTDRIFINELDHYFITFDGLLFIQKGGYKSENQKQHQDRWIKRITFFLLILTSVVAVIYSYNEILKNNDQTKAEAQIEQ